MKKKVLGILITSAIAGAMLMGCSFGGGKDAASAPPAAVESETKAQDSKDEDGAKESAAKTQAAETEAVSSEGFNPDKEAGASIEDVRGQFGSPVPYGSEEIMAGAVAKQFQNEYWRTLKEGYEEGARLAKEAGVNIKIDVQAALDENDEQGQLAILNNMINKKYSVLLLSPISDGNLVPGVESAVEKNIPVLNVNDGMALGVVEAVKESGKDILIVGVDGIGEAYDSIRKGGLSATIDSFPYYKAQIALECALRELAGRMLGVKDSDILCTPHMILTFLRVPVLENCVHSHTFTA